MRTSVVTLIVVLGLTSPLVAQRNFGTATALSGNDVVIGQPANFYGPGAVYVFRSNAMGEWTEAMRLHAPDAAIGDGFGHSLAATADRLIVGAPADEAVGAVHVFERDADGSWAFRATVHDPTGSSGTGFGTAVQLTDDGAVVGTPRASRVYLITMRAGRTTVTPIESPVGNRSGFGAALSLDGDVLLVGAPGAESGAAVAYRRVNGTWRQEQVLTGPAMEGRTSPRFGTSVLLDGPRAIVGAPGGDGGRGLVSVFERRGTSWTAIGQLRPGANERTDFGTALGAAGDEIWVGAPNAGDGDGTVFRFRPAPGGNWTAVGGLRPDSVETGAWRFGFGWSIAARDDRAVVGMPTRDFGEGRALIATRPSGEWTEAATVFGDIVPAAASIAPGTDCAEGNVAGFPCSNIEVVSFTPASALGGERGVWVNDVWGWTDPVTDRDYAIVSRRDGAAFVDLSDPAHPRLVGSLPRTTGARPTVWRDIKVIGNHAYIVADGAGPHGMQVFDLTRLRSVTGDPVTFSADAHYDRIHSAHNVVADTASQFLYIVGANGGGDTCGGGLHMVDARDPTNPTFAGCYNDPTGARATGYTHDAQCVVYRGPDTRYTGRQICVGSNVTEINIADVTDKDQPVPIGRSSYPNVSYAHQGWFDETQRYFYMGDEGDEVGGQADRTRTLVWDLTQLDDPILVKEYFAPVRATDHNLFVRGNLVYQSNYGSGLRVLDISDPENPREVAFFDSAPLGDNEAGMSSAQSGAWSNYPFFRDGLVVFTSVREGLFVVRVQPQQLVP